MYPKCARSHLAATSPQFVRAAERPSSPLVATPEQVLRWRMLSARKMGRGLAIFDAPAGMESKIANKKLLKVDLTPHRCAIWRIRPAARRASCDRALGRSGRTTRRSRDVQRADLRLRERRTTPQPACRLSGTSRLLTTLDEAPSLSPCDRREAKSGAYYCLGPVLARSSNACTEAR